ncbi:hypothetical protein [Streptomyces violascens]|uniref:hypothetical protein n=1 Tax=Streptomyces violascens TaxID=67381 RepID=UPI0036772E56
MSRTFADSRLVEAIADHIRFHRKVIASGNRYVSAFGTRSEAAGRFGTVGDSTVLVEVQVRFTEKYVYMHVPGAPRHEHRVQVGARAQCQGHGCIDPVHKTPDSAVFLLGDDADGTAETALPLVQKAREWAQAHAETCRAKPYTAR